MARAQPQDVGLVDEQWNKIAVVETKEQIQVGSAVIHCGDCQKVLRRVRSNSVSLMLTSPPYDNLRQYGGTYEGIDLNALGHEIYRVLRPGGIAVMVIQDATEGYAKSLTSMRTTLYWCETVGFKLFEMLAYSRHGAPGAQWRTRFRVDHEYMPVFLKGDAPAYFNKEHMAQAASTQAGWKAGKRRQMKGGAAKRQADGSIRYSKAVEVEDTTSRGTIWHYEIGIDNSSGIIDNVLKRKHPATFANKLAVDHIQCWTQAGDTVLDPFVGSGTVAAAAVATGRKAIGIELNPTYAALAQERCRLQIKPEG